MEAVDSSAALGLGSGDVSLSPSSLPNDNALFVQSTSLNRKVPDGAHVLVRQAGSETAPATAPAPPTTRQARNEDGPRAARGGAGDQPAQQAQQARLNNYLEKIL